MVALTANSALAVIVSRVSGAKQGLKANAIRTVTANSTVKNLYGAAGDAALSVSVGDTSRVTWAMKAAATLPVTATDIPTARSGVGVSLTATASATARATWHLNANASLAITVVRTTAVSRGDAATAALVVVMTTSSNWGMTVNAAMEIDTAARVVPFQTFVDYTQVADMAQNLCIGTGRSFRGSVFGQDNPAFCPHCKTIADRLGVPGVTEDLAANQSFVVPAHVDPDLVSLSAADASVLVSFGCNANMTWVSHADAGMPVTMTSVVNRQVPDKTADAALVVTANMSGGVSDWTTSADATLSVTATPAAKTKWTTKSDAALLERASTGSDGTNPWHANTTMPIVATPVSPAPL